MLFVSHEGSLTGAPMALLHLVRWLRDNSRIEPEVAILRDGPLTAQFAEVGPTTVLGTEPDWPVPSSAEQRLRDKGRDKAALRRQVARLRRDVAPIAGARSVYLNSAASVRLLHHLPRADAVIAHVHELRSALGWSLPPLDQELVRDRVDHVIAAADCVADNLVRQLGLDRRDITRIYEFIDPPRVVAPPERDRAEVLASLGIPADALVIGGSGWADWRKGIDLFTQLARDIDRRGRADVHLLWVGGLPGGEDGAQIEFDAARAGGRLHLVGLQSRPHDWYRAFDVLALTSREDPYPLVGLEAGLLEVPLICFDRSGGMTELVRRSEDEGLGESGVVVPYLDVEAMADAALALLDQPDRRRAMGALAATVVHRDHQVDVAGPQVLEVIERVLASAP
jgi:glycosyltransferase involved in cell wall biosynthesis